MKNMNESTLVHGPERDLDMLAEMVAIERYRNAGITGISPLIGYLSEAREHLAVTAVNALHGILPMAALPERWRDMTPYCRCDSETAIPEWLMDACDGWGAEKDFAQLCVEQLEGLKQTPERQRFLEKLSTFMGARQRVIAYMLAKGQKTTAREFAKASYKLQQRQFPKQVTLALTMNCQLRCQYCISGNTSTTGFEETQPQAIERLFDWMEQRGVGRLGLTGGEPTIYSRFEPLMEQIRERGFELYLATNGLASKVAVAAIIRTNPLCVTMHLTPEVLGSKMLETYIGNARSLISAGVYVIMRCNFLNTTDDPLAYLKTAKKAGISEIRTAIPMPKASGGNRFVDIRKLEQYGPLLDRLASAGRLEGISIRLAKPFPMCFMARETATQFLENGSLAAACPVHFSGYTNNIIVHSDLRYTACLGLDQLSEEPIVAFKELVHAAKAHRKRVQTLVRKPIMSACRACPLWKGGRCIGACLSYRTSTQATSPSPANRGL